MGLYYKVPDTKTGVITEKRRTREQFGVGKNSPESTCIKLGYYLGVGTMPLFNASTQTLDISESFDAINKNVAITYTIIDIPFTDLQSEKLALLKRNTQTLLDDRPIINVTLADTRVLSVDAGASDLRNLEAGQALGLTFIIDSNNISQTIAVTDWDTILNAIRANGLSILQNKWTLKAQIEVSTTIAELDLIVV